MSQFLRGNFSPRTEVKVEQTQETIEDRFEQAALAKLGGSIGYVSRRGFLWVGDEEQKFMADVGRAGQYDNDGK